MRSLRSTFSNAASLLMLLSCLSCGDNPGAPRGGVATLSISDDTLSLLESDTARLVASPRDAQGNLMTGVTIEWSSSAPNVAAVVDGLVTALNSGAASIRASSGGVSVTTVVLVTAELDFLALYPAAASLLPGDSMRVELDARSAQLDQIPGLDVTWSSSDSAVAIVTLGFIKAIGSGMATITGTARGKSAGVLVTVDDSTRQLTFVGLSAGGSHTCGIAQDSRAYCWGDNSRGQLGTGSMIPSATPIAVAGNLQFTSISAGNQYTCALTATGAAYCWGDTTWGQLGNGGLAVGGCVDSWCGPVPTLVEGGHTFRSIVSGFDHACAITTEGSLYCWGWGENGELGWDAPKYCNPIGDAACSDSPVLASKGEKYIAVAAGFEHTCGLRENGAAFCWGHEHHGQLGGGPEAQAGPIAVAVAGGLSFASLAAGGNSGCAVTLADIAYCWGENTLGQLGDSSNANRFSPVKVAGDLRFSLLTTGTSPAGSASTTCGLVLERIAYCWGTNTDGGLGDGSRITRYAPVRVSGGLTFGSISAGGLHTCGLTSGDVAYCWGANRSGQLGTDATTDTTIPRRVARQVP